MWFKKLSGKLPRLFNELSLKLPPSNPPFPGGRRADSASRDWSNACSLAVQLWPESGRAPSLSSSMEKFVAVGEVTVISVRGARSWRGLTGVPGRVKGEEGEEDE